MFRLFLALSLAACSSAHWPLSCPQGYKILAHGVTEDQEIVIVTMFNNIRENLNRGMLKGEPKPINLPPLTYDHDLSESAEDVSKSCNNKHIFPKIDGVERGQNIETTYSSVKELTADWDGVIIGWMLTRRFFTYPNVTETGMNSAHYLQIVNENVTRIGCAYVMFQNNDNHAYPYSKLYTCNFDGARDLRGAPYRTDDDLLSSAL